MGSIRADTTVEELAAIVSEALRRHGIQAVLTGGACVSIYTDNAYPSLDLDFVSASSSERIGEALASIGMSRLGRHYRHPRTPLHVEFPAPPLSIGDAPVRSWARRKTAEGTIQLLTPTQSVMDRLAGYFHWSDRQSLDQAVAIAMRHKVDLRKIRHWAKKEGAEEKYREFVKWSLASRRSTSKAR